MNYRSTYSFTRISFLFCWMVILLAFQTIKAQAPGGVTTGLNLWLDASNGTTVAGNNLTNWTDKTTTNTFTVSAIPPTVAANAINFHSTVDFSNSTSTDIYPSEQNLIGDTPINFTDAYAVFKVNDGNGGVIVGGTIPGSSYGKAVFAEFNSGIHSGNGDPTTYSNFPFTDFDNYHVFGMDAGLTGNMIGRLDGTDQTVTNLTGFSTMSLIPTIGTTNNNGNLAGWNHLNGQIAEVIIYDQTTAGQRVNIESYLALKYGIHKAGNYVNSTNTILWDAAANAAYHNDVFGLGQDDTSGLLQTQSNSMNTGSGNGTGQSGKGNIVISNPSALVNDSFLMIGHNTADFSVVATLINSQQGWSKINRSWKVQTTNSLGAVNLQFDATGLNLAELANYKLLIDTDGDGNFATGIVTTIGPSSIAGSVLNFNNITLNQSEVFSFGFTAIHPGGVAGEVAWYKGDAGITLNGSTIAQWNDSSGNNNNATQATAGNQPAFTTNSINFNASGTFAVLQDLIAPVNNLPLGNSPRSVYLVSTTSTSSTTGWVYGYGTTSPGQAFNVGKLANSAPIYASGFGTGGQSSSNFWDVNVPKLGSVTYDSSAISFFDGGTPIGSITLALNTTLTANSARIGCLVNGNTETWRGKIAEIIVYPSVVSGSTALSIESYLSIKYGIHKAGNYINSTGTVIWNATTNAAYHNDVFGIGQDDGSLLLQAQSNSSNTGSGDGTGQSGKGNIVISNPSSLGNNKFLLIGHDTNALTEADILLGSNLIKRVQRLWKVQSAGNMIVSLSYDIAGLTYSAQSFNNYVLLVDLTGSGSFGGGSVVQYPAAAISGTKLSFNNVYLPSGAVFSFQTLATPTVQATNVAFTNTTGTTTTASWTNGNGSSRAVFMYAGASGSPVPTNNTTYTANTAFGTGTQIGTTGWYCVYNGTGTTVNITGLTPATTYQLMTVEYNGLAGSELYRSAVSTGNPAGVITISNIATLSDLSISDGTLNPVFDSATTSYTATVANVITSLTLTPTITDANATVTVNGVSVASGSPSGAIALAVGPNVITTIVTAQDGSTIKTYTVTVTRTEPTIITTGTLTALTTVYGTPSASSTFSVSGTDMAAGILVTPPSGFEVSTDNTTFTNTVTVGAVGIIASTPVYLRLKATISVGSYSGDIILTSSNATTVNVPTVLSTVTPAPLTISADNQGKIYGDANPTLTISYSGFVNGDIVASLTTLPSSATTAVTGSPVGTYPITVSGAANSNYTISYIAGTLTVSPVVLTVTANDQTKVYGDANPTLTASYSGFVNGDTAADLTTQATVATTGLTGSPVGTYPITASGAVSANYTFSYVAGTLTVTPVVLTVTADNKTKVYGDANPTLTASYSGFVNGDTAADLTTQATLTTTGLTGSPVGTYPITASGAVSANYTFSYVAGTLTVTPVVLTITADNKTKVYGDANPTLTASYSGFVNGDTAADLTTQATLTTTGLTGSPVGTYPITASGAVSANYTFTYVAGTLTVTPVTLTVTADNQTKVYGDANPTLTASYSEFVNGDTAADLTTQATLTTTGLTGSPVGTYPITASGAVSANYTFSYVAGTLTVTKAVLTVTADAQTKVYGAANPTLTATYTGFANGETVASLLTPATLSTTAITASPVGTYPITASGATSDNYTFTYVAGTLTVTKAVLTVTADAQSKVYGAANPTLTATYTGFANGETVASLLTPATLSTTAITASPVGTYPITASGATSDNYTFTYVAGILTVTKAVLTVTADAQSKVYGAANPTLTATYTGFANGETVASLLTPATLSTTAITASPVGTYPITASGATSDNYTFTYVAGILTVTKAVLTVTADAQTKVYGAANPTLTATYTGFANGETVASLLTPATLSTTAITVSAVGTYPITASGATSDNYTFTYVAGILTVTKAVLTVTADAQSKVYGAANPTLTATYTGFANGETVASLLTPATLSTTAITASPVGTYPITASGATSDNYTFTYVAGILTVTKAVLTVTADAQTKVYGAANPTLTATYTGFANGETVASLLTPATLSTTAITASPVGTYPITASGATSDNYTFTYVAGILTVTKAVLTVTADAQTKVYGAANPTLTATYTGFANGETVASLLTPATLSTTAITASAVGTYPITASGATSDNYTFTYVAGILTVTPVVLTVTADNKTKIYGDANPTLTASYSGFVNGDTAADLTTQATLTTTGLTGSPVGTYPITASGAVSSNYTFSYVAGTLTVTPVTLTVTADNQTKVYGDANPTLTASYTGFVNGDTVASLTTAPTISTTALNTSDVGSYPITASGAVDSNYTISYVAGNLTVTTATLTITADNQSKIYGSANPALTASYTGFVNGDTAASLTTAPTISTTATTASNVGSYPITASGAVDSNYAISYVAGNLIVTPATLTITANDQTKTYGSANPILTASYTGFVNGDTAASLTTPPTISTTATNTSNVGSYPITASGAVDSNYTISYVAGNLTVTTATLIITANDQSKTYGSANPTLTASYTGFVNGDTAASLTTAPTISTTATNTSDVGTYPITASGAVDSNYAISYVAGNLTVTTATLTITANDQTKTYGSANPILTASYTGFVNGDTVASLTTAPTISTTATTASNVGSYPITASGAVDSNYTISYVAGNLIVITATLTITANDQTKTYGSANPALTASYSGFVNGDTAASLTTAPTISTTATNTSNVGSYPITASGAVDLNYAISYVAGNLTVTTATLTITANDQSKTYGSANPTLTASYTGFVNGDTAASLATAPTISTTATNTSDVGTYPITASGAVDSNYAISYVAGNLTVTTATLTITANDQSKTYGSANPALTASYSGFVNGDTAASLATAPTISTTATTASNVGSYPITATGAVDPNYAISYVGGNLTVTTATLTITANDQSKTYGSANPTLTASYTGFVNGDTTTSLATAPTISTTATTASNVGSYPITASGAVDSNYTISYVGGNLTVTTATLTITANDQSKTYGSANPTLTASYTGFVNGDTAASLATAPTISTTATTASNVGSYPISATGAVDPNYAISYVAGNLTVTTAILTITADDKTKTYGSANPTLTVSYEGFVNGDTAASLTTQPMILTTATTTSNVGTYPITASDAVASNYTFSYVEGLLTITPSTTDVNLASLSVNIGVLSPAFSPDILEYSVNIGNDITTETITVASENPLDKITINGVVILNGGSLTPASLVKGINKMIIKVTSPDGSVTKTYTLNIIKEGSDIATLSNLSISNGILEPEFESDVKNYSTVVKYDVNSITVTPIVSDINATITVNGVTVANATASTPILLNPGENTIKTVVTAEDGTTKETYTIVVYKGVPPDKVTATNVLSPNGDGKNDFWEIKDILLYPNNVVTVYDRAGRIVYSKKSYSNDWGGLFNGSPLNNDTYYYLIDLGDALPKIKGFITIIRD